MRAPSGRRVFSGKCEKPPNGAEPTRPAIFSRRRTSPQPRGTQSRTVHQNTNREQHVNSSNTRRVALAAAALATIACGSGDYRIDQLDTGVSIDSALKVMEIKVDSSRMPPPGALVPSSDTLKNVWRRAEYLVNGNKIEVLYYSPNDEKWKATDTVPKERVIPVIFVNGKVFGTGRAAYREAVKQFNLPDAEY